MTDRPEPVVEPDPHRADAAPYVLGALSAADRTAFEEHLRGCGRCRAAVDEVAALPALLDLVPVEVIERLAAGPDLDPGPLADSDLHGAVAHGAVPRRLVDDLAGRRPAEPPEHLLPALRSAARQHERRRRRSRRFVLAAAAAVVVLLGVLPGLPWSPDRSVAERVELSAVVDGPMVAEVSLRSQEWGTRIEVDCHYREAERSGSGGVAPGTAGPYDTGVDEGPTDYSLVLTDVDGRDEQVATWSARPGTRMSIPAATALPRHLIAGIELRGDRGTALLRADLSAGQPS